MYLIDTNVWLERLLDQERTVEVKELLDIIPSENLFITDFAFHSIAIVLIRFKKEKDFLNFITDAFIDGSVSLIHLQPTDIYKVISAIEKFKLDFDDAYLYITTS